MNKNALGGEGKQWSEKGNIHDSPHDLSNLNVITAHAKQYDTKQIIK